MAYELYYTANFTNEQSQETLVSIYKKDAAAPAEVENYALTRCETVDSGEKQSPFNCIIIRELIISLDTRDSQTISWETFVDSEHDTWKVVAMIDGEYYFHGFITPDEGRGPFQDKPYDVTISAINGLALLKNVALSDISSNDFDGDHPLIDYIAGALKKTLLDLPIRIYCGYFHLSMQNKANSLDDDMFQQTDLNYRTFMTDATTFVSCYDALKIILDEFCTLEYWNGLWLIMCIAERQYTPNPSGELYNVDYDSDGAVIGGNLDTRNYGRIGKQMEIYPINETQSISSKSGVKFVKTAYDYIPLADLPKNSKFERGTEFETGTATDEDDIDNDGDTSETIGTYKKFTIDDTQYGKFSSGNSAFPFNSNSELGYRKSIYNSFGIEIERKIILENTTGTNNYLLMEGIPVKSQSKIKVSFDFKHTGGSVDFGSKGIIRIYLYPTGVTNDALFITSTNNRWQPLTSTVDSYSYFYDNGEDSSKWKSFTIEPDAIPQDGTVYVLMQNTGTGGDHEYRNFSIEYTPFIAGGYIQVKGDYIKRTNSANFLQVIDEKVSISDSPQRIFKGALLFNDQLTDPAWYRHGPLTSPNHLGEQKHFKELLNISRYNYHYRRMYYLEGGFNGLNWAPQNDDLVKLPLGFFWMYKEVDMTEPRDFVLIPPLKMDLIKGWVAANLVEVKKDVNDGTQTGTGEFKYQF